MTTSFQPIGYTKPFRVTSKPGESRAGGTRRHKGYDIDGVQGMPLINTTNKKIIISRKVADPENKTPGGSIITFYVEGDETTLYTYAHLSGLPAKDVINPGEEFGKIGGEKGQPGSGTSTDGAHLHMEAARVTKDALGKEVSAPIDPINGQVVSGHGKRIMEKFEDYSITGGDLSSEPVSAETLKDMFQDLDIKDGLDEVDPLVFGIVGNPHLRRVESPITFKIVLNDLDPSKRYLSDSQGRPLELSLNCSLTQLNIQMKHIVNKSNGRTGFHLTFWGMEPDTISGSGSTGVFMNSYGLTSIMSLTEPNNAYLDSNRPNADNPEDLRVAAQDNFVELLSVFRNNGVVRFHTENYDDTVRSRKQLEAVWSEQYGANTYERYSRNNDVLARGSVLMTYKNNSFQGYFKNLSWTMDSDNPYHWRFDFTFLVQRTISFVRYGCE